MTPRIILLAAFLVAVAEYLGHVRKGEPWAWEAPVASSVIWHGSSNNNWSNG
jgi:hypothetical protein